MLVKPSQLWSNLIKLGQTRFKLVLFGTGHYRKSRRIRLRHNIVRQLLSNGIISIDYIKSKDNVANPLTKGLTRE